jgi:hypothetical protein
VPCAISTDAIDRTEGSSRTTPDLREQQFLRLRDRIEQRAAWKFLDFEFEGTPEGHSLLTSAWPSDLTKRLTSKKVP